MAGIGASGFDVRVCARAGTVNCDAVSSDVRGEFSGSGASFSS